MHTQETHAISTASLDGLHPGVVVGGNAETGTSTKCYQKGAVRLPLSHGGTMMATADSMTCRSGRPGISVMTMG